MRTRTIVIASVLVIMAIAVGVGVMIFYVTTPTPVVASRPSDASPARIVSDAKPAPGKLAVIRVAHASVLLDFDGEQVLTDPWFTDTEEYQHGEPLGYSLNELSKLTAVVASHEHYDH